MSRPIAVLALALGLGAAGCASNGPQRFDVSGSVSYNGQPVPKGFITFEPDSEQGNSGPGGGADIVNGKYRTAPGKGVVGGHYVVKIVGYDGVATTVSGENLPDGNPLFAPYHTKVEFPRENVERDFQVTANE